MNNSVWEKRRKRLFELIEIGSNYDISRKEIPDHPNEVGYLLFVQSSY